MNFGLLRVFPEDVSVVVGLDAVIVGFHLLTRLGYRRTATGWSPLVCVDPYAPHFPGGLSQHHQVSNYGRLFALALGR